MHFPRNTNITHKVARAAAMGFLFLSSVFIGMQGGSSLLSRMRGLSDQSKGASVTAVDDALSIKEQAARNFSLMERNGQKKAEEVPEEKPEESDQGREEPDQDKGDEESRDEGEKDKEDGSSTDLEPNVTNATPEVPTIPAHLQPLLFAVRFLGVLTSLVILRTLRNQPPANRNRFADMVWVISPQALYPILALIYGGILTNQLRGIDRFKKPHLVEQLTSTIDQSDLATFELSDRAIICFNSLFWALSSLRLAMFLGYCLLYLDTRYGMVFHNRVSYLVANHVVSFGLYLTSRKDLIDWICQDEDTDTESTNPNQTKVIDIDIE